MTDRLFVRPFAPADELAVNAHLERHRKESGHDGLHFMPFAPDDPDGPRPVDVVKATSSLQEPEWQRWFLAEDRDSGEIVGHVNLQQKRLRAALHRCEIGVGLEEAARGQGIGKQLMQTAIAFAQEQPSIDWIDLRVFAHNINARILYKRLGFREIGVLYDWLRIENQSIDDIIMVLDVR